MRSIEVLEKNPHATLAIKEWFMKEMIESFKDKDVPDEFKEYMRQQGITNEALSKIIDANPRLLFDVFDDNKLIINVVKKEGGFLWNINDVWSMDPYHDNRKEAETWAIKRAFTLLNHRLEPKLSTDDEGSHSTTGVGEICPAE